MPKPTRETQVLPQKFRRSFYPRNLRFSRFSKNLPKAAE